MSPVLELSNNGQTFKVFNRRGTIVDEETLSINGPSGSIEIKPGKTVSEWIINQLSAMNGLADSCFVYLGPATARLLWFEGCLSEDQIQAAEESGVRPCSDLVDGGEGFVFPEVIFPIASREFVIPVLVVEYEQGTHISIVEGKIPSTGPIRLTRMTKKYKTTI